MKKKSPSSILVRKVASGVLECVPLNADSVVSGEHPDHPLSRCETTGGLWTPGIKKLNHTSSSSESMRNLVKGNDGREDEKTKESFSGTFC